MEALSLSSRPVASSACPVSGALYVLDRTESPAKPSAKIKPRPLPEVIEHDRAVMRDLVLGAFLGAQHFREDDGKFVGQYTTENTRGPSRRTSRRCASALPRMVITSVASPPHTSPAWRKEPPA